MTIEHRVTPIPHLIVRDVLPDGVYSALNTSWPALEQFEVSRSGKKFDIRADDFARLPDAWREWLRESPRVIGELVAPYFTIELSARLWEIGAREYRANQGRLMMRVGPYRLLPHLDPAPYVLTLLLYFPSPGQEVGHGTVLYRAPQPLETGTGSTQYFGDHGIACIDPVEIPFTPNTLLAFPNSPIAAHGVRVPPGQTRRVFQWHLSTKAEGAEI